MDSLIMRRRSYIMADDYQFGITVVDVYDQASSIGKEFEKIIDIHGVDAVTDLMPKVIQILEQLENCAQSSEKESNEVNELKLAVDKLEAEKHERAQERHRYEQELEQIEDNWRIETKDLLGMVTKLQEENKRLHSRLSFEKEENEEETKKRSEDEVLVLLKPLKDTIDRQRDELRLLQREVGQKTVESETAHSQLERVTKQNADLRRKNMNTRKQARSLLEEKADLQTQIHAKEQQINHVTTLLNDYETESDRRKARASSYDRELKEMTASTDNILENGSPDDVTTLQHKLSLIGKMVIDMSDPDRPRFTLKELRQVIMERNELKTKLVEVEEELHIYKAKSNDEEEEEPAVEGPINREPDEKLYPERYLRRRPGEESGIRKFFARFFDGPSNKDSPEKGRRNSILTSTGYYTSPSASGSS